MSFLSWIETEFKSVEAFFASLVGSGSTIAAVVATDVQIVGAGLKGALADFTALTGVDTTAIENDISAIFTAAESVTDTVEKNIAQPIVTQIGADFAALVAVLPADLPAVVADVISAVKTLLPIIEAGVGIIATSADLKAAMSANTMDPDRARLILQAHAAKA